MNLFYETPDGRAKLYLGDSRHLDIPDESIDMIATSPPYWGKRDYGEDVVTIWGGEDGCEHEWYKSPVRDPVPPSKRQCEKCGRFGVTRWLADRIVMSKCEHCGHQTQHDEVDTRGFSMGVKDAGDFDNWTTKETHPEPDAYCSLCGAWRGQLGLEPTWQEYIAHLRECAKEWWRVLKPTGNLFVNMGDTFASKPPGNKPSWSTSGLHGAATSKTYQDTLDASVMATADTSRGNIPKMKLGIPYRLRFALNDMGWVSRDDIIWYKGKEYPDGHITKVAMPESVKDRMSCSYEMLFHFVKEPKGYFFDLDAVRRPHAQSSLDRARYPYNVYPHAWEEGAIPVSGGKTVNLQNHPAGANPGDVWIIQPEPFKEAHYAVWPSKLCEMMIKVGCPKEVCPKCGKPRERIVGREKHPDRDVEKQRRESAQRTGRIDGFTEGPSGMMDTTYTIGWSDCGCGGGFVSGVVLDPFFGGSGRIAERALYLGRNIIGVDMKEEYLEMAKKRLLQGMLL